MNKRIFGGGFAAVMLLAGLALAGPLEDGQAAYTRGDFATALSLWQPLADQGNAEAQLGVGRLYDNGEGVTQDYAAAMKWYRAAADQGSPEAQFAVGQMYEMARGTVEDLVEAASWYKLAAPALPAAATRLRIVTERLMSDPDGPG
jgi:TPR repeat protein